MRLFFSQLLEDLNVLLELGDHSHLHVELALGITIPDYQLLSID